VHALVKIERLSFQNVMLELIILTNEPLYSCGDALFDDVCLQDFFSEGGP